MLLFFSEDLVLAEDRTTEADRELIMEGRIPPGINNNIIIIIRFIFR